MAWQVRKGVGKAADQTVITAVLLLTTVRALLGTEAGPINDVTGPINDVRLKLRACQYGNLPGTWTQLPQVQGRGGRAVPASWTVNALLTVLLRSC